MHVSESALVSKRVCFFEKLKNLKHFIRINRRTSLKKVKLHKWLTLKHNWSRKSLVLNQAFFQVLLLHFLIHYSLSHCQWHSVHPLSVGGLNLLPNFQRRAGLTGAQLWEGVFGKEGGTSGGGCNFSKKK